MAGRLLDGRCTALGVRRTLGMLLAVAAVAMASSSGAVAAQPSSLTLTSLKIGGLLGTDAARAHLVLQGDGEPSGAPVLQLRSYAGALVATGSMLADTNQTVYEGGVIAADFSSGANHTHIALYSQTTLALTANLDGGFTPRSLAVAGGQVWMVDATDNSLRSVEIASPHTQATYPGLFPGSFATLIGALGSPATVYTESFTNPTATFQAINVTSTPTVTGTHSVPFWAGPDSGFAVAQSGSEVALAESTNGVELLDPATLAVQATLTTPGQADAVALSADGSRVLITDADSATSGDQGALYWMEDASGNLLYTATISPTTAALDMPHARAAFTSDAGFSILGTSNLNDLHPTLYTFAVPATLPAFWSRLTVQPDATTVGSTATIAGTLYASPQSGATGQDVQVLVTPPGGTQSSAGTATIAGDGSFSYTSPALDHTGTWTYTIQYQGGGGFSASAATVPVPVTGQSDTLTLTTSAAKVVYGHSVTVAAALSPFTPGAVVTITKTIKGVTSTIYNGPVDSSGHVSLLQTPHSDATYHASFAGDSTYNPAAGRKQTVSVLPVITGGFPGGYATKAGYRLFHYNSTCTRTHNSGCPHFSATMAPNGGGQFVYMTIQHHTSTGWHSVVTYRKRLTSRSKALFPLPYTNAKVIGQRYRLVMTFNGDTDYGAVAWGYWDFRITH